MKKSTMLILLLLIPTAFIAGTAFAALKIWPYDNLAIAYRSLNEDSENDLPTVTEAVSAEVFAAMTEGQTLIHFRHATRAVSTDIVVFDFLAHRGEDHYGDFTCLNAEGKAQARATGAIFKEFAIPVSDVHASSSCRAVEHATLAALLDTESTRIDDAWLYSGVSPASVEDLHAQRRNLIFGMRKAAGNTVVFGHDHHLEIAPWMLDTSEAKRDQGGATVYRLDEGNRTMTEIMTFATLHELLAIFTHHE